MLYMKYAIFWKLILVLIHQKEDLLLVVVNSIMATHVS